MGVGVRPGCGVGWGCGLGEGVGFLFFFLCFLPLAFPLFFFAFLFLFFLAFFFALSPFLASAATVVLLVVSVVGLGLAAVVTSPRGAAPVRLQAARSANALAATMPIISPSSASDDPELSPKAGA